MPESAPPPETSHVLWIIKIQGQDNQKKPLATLSLGVNWLFSQFYANTKGQIWHS